MIHKKLFKKAFLVLLIVGILNFIGVQLYFYDSIWWYDIVQHMLSGSLIAMGTFLLWNFFLPFTITHKKKMIIIALISTLIVGAIWEWYELHFGLTFLSDGAIYVFDTTKDMIDDLIGGFFGSLYAIKVLNKK